MISNGPKYTDGGEKTNTPNTYEDQRTNTVNQATQKTLSSEVMTVPCFVTSVSSDLPNTHR